MKKKGSCESATQDRHDTDVGRQIRIALTAMLPVLLFIAFVDYNYIIEKTFAEDHNGRQEERPGWTWNWQL